MSEFVLQGVRPGNIGKHADAVVRLVREYGMVVLPGYFSEEPRFVRYLAELRATLLQMASKYGVSVLDQEIGELLTAISKVEPTIARVIADLGTQPNKFFSFNNLKYSAEFDDLLLNYFGKGSIVTTPPAGDTLHFFPPGEGFHRYNLPPHQDYPYLMQSPDQLTFYLGISAYFQNVGGLRVWGKSHREGLLPTEKSPSGSFEIHSSSEILTGYSQVDFAWNPGDLGIFDSLLPHASVPNSSLDHSRIVQIFRFSNINNDVSRSYDYYSTSYTRRSVQFEQVHHDLFL